MSESAARSRKIDALCGAALRALSGDHSLALHERHLWRGRRAMPPSAPHLAPFDEHAGLTAFRGAADGMALRARHSDAEIHARACPADPAARTLFELLEQLRCESLAGAALPGVAGNLRRRHVQWAEAFARSGLAETAQGVLLYTVALVCRARVSAEPVPEPVEGLIEATRMALASDLGPALAGLRRERSDQAAYARHARAIAEAIARRLRAAHPSGGGAAPREGETRSARHALFALAFAPEGVESGVAQAASSDSGVMDEAGGAYRVFTTAYDQELRAAALVREALRREYRERLDRRIAALRVPLAQLARALQAALAQPVRDGWDAAQDTGRLDGRRVAQLVASPTERRLFRNERQLPQADAVVSFLVDCSGSMKAHAEDVALLVDVFARALELAGAACEVLGFTTGAWNGGRALRDWQRAGRPRHPGRLNEACHLVFKEADTPWRRARGDIAALLKADLFREGIDGEAVDWACRRLSAHGAARRLLVVVSDGCPMDRATELANDAHYLDQHLRETAARWESGGAVTIIGLGVGLDLAPFYARSIALDVSQGWGPAAWGELVRVLGARSPVPQREAASRSTARRASATAAKRAAR